MRRYWRYLWYIVRHKYWVYVAGRMLQLPIGQLLLHDLSKFGSAEFTQYAKAFYDRKGNSRYESSAEFDKAWEHHYKHNPHHWEFWVAYKTALRMEERYAKELVADLAGTGKVKQGEWEFNEWFEANIDDMTIHHETKELIRSSIKDLQYQLQRRGYIDA